MGDDTPEMRAKKIESMRKVMAILFPPTPQETLMVTPQATALGISRRSRTSVVGLI
jgi:hypothetical protein